MVQGNILLLDCKELDAAETVTEVLALAKALEQRTIVFNEFLLEILRVDEFLWQPKVNFGEEHKHICKLESLKKRFNVLSHFTSSQDGS